MEHPEDIFHTYGLILETDYHVLGYKDYTHVVPNFSQYFWASFSIKSG